MTTHRWQYCLHSVIGNHIHHPFLSSSYTIKTERNGDNLHSFRLLDNKASVHGPKIVSKILISVPSLS